MITHRLLIDVIHHRLVMSGNLASILKTPAWEGNAGLGEHVFRRTKYVRRNTSWEAKS